MQVRCRSCRHTRLQNRPDVDATSCLASYVIDGAGPLSNQGTFLRFCAGQSTFREIFFITCDRPPSLLLTAATNAQTAEWSLTLKRIERGGARTTSYRWKRMWNPSTTRQWHPAGPAPQESCAPGRLPSQRIQAGQKQALSHAQAHQR